MLNFEHKQKLQNLFNRLDDEEVEAIYALATHFDEETTLRAIRREADGELELGRDERLVSEVEVGFHYGEAAGTAKTRDSIVGELGRLMSQPLRQD